LCDQLAIHYKSQWVPEYAREYLERNGTQYKYEDLYEIAIGQMKCEDAVTGNGHSVSNTGQAQPTLVFLDTDLYTIKIWSEISFNCCDNRILTQIAKRTYDAYLLCNTDLPWSADPQREYPDLKSRQKIYSYYKDVLVNQDKPWVDISGNYEERFLKAVKAVDRVLA
jgi:nicotinamide riboside kinase